MPFLQVSHDRRGYEITYLMHPGGPGARPRILYVFRTPPGVRVGRDAIDEEAIRELERCHPDVKFDWSRLLKPRAPARGDATQDSRAGSQPRGERPRRAGPGGATPRRSRRGPGSPPAGRTET